MEDLCRPGADGPGGRGLQPRPGGPAEQRRRVRRRDLASAGGAAAGDGRWDRGGGTHRGGHLLLCHHQCRGAAGDGRPCWWESPPAAAWTTSAPSVAFSLPNSGIQIGVSTKYIDLGTLLDADAGRGVESLEPDVAGSPDHGGHPGGPGHRCGVAAGPPGDGWSSGHTPMRPSPGAGSWGCCMRRPGPLPQRRRPRFPGPAGHRVVSCPP